MVRFLFSGICASFIFTVHLRQTAAFALQMCFNAFNKEADLDVLYHPVLNFFYYLVSVTQFSTVPFLLQSGVTAN
jgi:hypothetical protein